MQSFAWKKKNCVTNKRHSVFHQEEKEEELDPDVDWLTAAKRPKFLLLEDKISKAKRLRSKGLILADEERWWEAINYWGEVVSLIPQEYEVHDMIAQAYMKVGEIFPAVRSALSATELAPTWWPGFQTLGRSQLGIGEVSLAIKSFSKAIHLFPDQMELWKDDFEWAVKLRDQQNKLKKEDEDRNLQKERENSLILEEIDDDYEADLKNATIEKSQTKLKGDVSSSSTNDIQTTIKKDVMKTSLVFYKR